MKRDHQINLETNVRNKARDDIQLDADGEITEEIYLAGSTTELQGKAKEDLVFRQQMQASMLSQNHLKHNLYKGVDFNKPKKFHQPPATDEKPVSTLVDEIILPPLSTFVIHEEPELEDDNAGIQKLEYPLKERQLNDKGQSIVYEEYKDRFRDDSEKLTLVNKRDRAGLGDLCKAAG